MALGLTVEDVKNILFNLISECWNESPLQNDSIDGALVYLYSGEDKREFVTTTVESFFWMQLARFLPEFC